MATTQTEPAARSEAAQAALREKLIDYLQDTHAMEQNVLRMLDAMIGTTDDPETIAKLRRHRFDTERHEKVIRERLEANGASPSLAAEMPAIMGAWMKGLADRFRTDKPGKNARDAYITEHVEIAAYSLLEHLAYCAGDIQTAHAARFIREEEEEMARWIASRWDRFVDLTLSEAGMTRESRRWFSGAPRYGSRPWYDLGNNTMTVLALLTGACVAGYLFSRLPGEVRSERWS